MSTMHDLVFLFDVDNTLLDNDRVQADLATYLIEACGVDACKLTGIFSNSCGASSAMPTTSGHWNDSGSKRCTIQGYCACHVGSSTIRFIEARLMRSDTSRNGVPRSSCPMAMPVFQPRKIDRSGLWAAFDGRVLIYVHKGQELADRGRQSNC
jgi:hypothetical protein